MLHYFLRCAHVERRSKARRLVHEGRLHEKHGITRSLRWKTWGKSSRKSELRRKGCDPRTTDEQCLPKQPTCCALKSTEHPLRPLTSSICGLGENFTLCSTKVVKQPDDGSCLFHSLVFVSLFNDRRKLTLLPILRAPVQCKVPKCTRSVMSGRQWCGIIIRSQHQTLCHFLRHHCFCGTTSFFSRLLHRVKRLAAGLPVKGRHLAFEPRLSRVLRRSITKTHHCNTSQSFIQRDISTIAHSSDSLL